MLQEELKTALQAGRHKPPEGFEERSDMQLLKLTAEIKPGRRMPRAAVILCAVLLAMGIATTLAATVDIFNARLYAFWPEAAEFLMPVEAACEKEGIRMEVLSAVVKDGKAHITFSMQDLEGDRLNEHTGVSFSELAFPVNPGEEYTARGSLCLSYDEKDKKAVYAQEFDYDPALIDGDYEIPLYIQEICLDEYETTDLLPMLGTGGENAETAPLPETAHPVYGFGSYTGIKPEETEGLDPLMNRKIRLGEYAELSGIGWVNGMLHIQIHYPDHMMQTLDSGNEYFPATGWVLAQTAEGISPWYSYQHRVQDTAVIWGWDENDDGFDDWEEYIFPLDPAELKESTLRAEIRLNDRSKILKGDWFVKIPIRMIRFDSRED